MRAAGRAGTCRWVSCRLLHESCLPRCGRAVLRTTPQLWSGRRVRACGPPDRPRPERRCHCTMALPGKRGSTPRSQQRREEVQCPASKCVRRTVWRSAAARKRTPGSTVPAPMPFFLRRSRTHSTNRRPSRLESPLVSLLRFCTAVDFQSCPRSPFTAVPAHRASASLHETNPCPIGIARLAAHSLFSAACHPPILRGLTLPGVIVDPSNYLLAREG